MKGMRDILKTGDIITPVRSGPQYENRKRSTWFSSWVGKPMTVKRVGADSVSVYENSFIWLYEAIEPVKVKLLLEDKLFEI